MSVHLQPKIFAKEMLVLILTLNVARVCGKAQSNNASKEDLGKIKGWRAKSGKDELKHELL